MRKNRMMRAASALLVAVLLTTSTISGTFAKYVTTASGSDTARVAKWGVEVGVTGSLFEDSYKDDPTDWLANEHTIDITVQSKTDNVDLVAPGTKNDTGITFVLRGTPEVDTNVVMGIEINKEVKLPAKTGYIDFTKATGYNTVTKEPIYGDTFDVDSDYYPVVFTLKNGAGDVLVQGNLTAIKNFFAGISKDYDTNTDLSKIGHGVDACSANETDGTYNLTWAWAYGEFANITANDRADTYIGQVASEQHTDNTVVTEMDVEITLTVTQID